MIDNKRKGRTNLAFFFTYSSGCCNGENAIGGEAGWYLLNFHILGQKISGRINTQVKPVVNKSILIYLILRYQKEACIFLPPESWPPSMWNIWSFVTRIETSLWYCGWWPNSYHWSYYRQGYPFPEDIFDNPKLRGNDTGIATCRCRWYALDLSLVVSG